MNDKVTAWRASIAQREMNAQIERVQRNAKSYTEWKTKFMQAVDLAIASHNPTAIVNVRNEDANPRALRELSTYFKITKRKRKTYKSEQRHWSAPFSSVSHSYQKKVVDEVFTEYVVTLR
jgi:alpha-D-ribose 1-methylphosphonate 5-triphosphate diphosphatase PhnM